MEIDYPVVIFLLGFGGLFLTFLEGQGEVMSKVPLFMLFIFIMGLGIFLKLYPRDGTEEIFGEVDGQRGFG